MCHCFTCFKFSDCPYLLFILSGVETSYDENLYTTLLDKSNCGISEQEASRLAAEIEHGSRHRHQRYDDSQVCESR